MNTFTHPLYKATTPSPYSGREDSLENERIFQIIECVDLHFNSPTKQKVIAGFASDEGVKRNHGRIGASSGPSAFRNNFGGIAVQNLRHLIDVGDIHCHNNDLETSQDALSDLIHHLHLRQNKTLIIGGGHEISFGHYMGLLKAYPTTNIGIINFDAHFDLRHNAHGRSSGTPFLDIANALKKDKKGFFYTCLGISPLANTKSLFKTAKTLGVNHLTQADIFTQSLHEQTNFLDSFIEKVDAIYITICLDVFQQAYAPGVSAPQPLGLAPYQVQPLLEHIMERAKVVSIDIAELSPPFDKNNQTSKLANQLAANLLEHW